MSGQDFPAPFQARRGIRAAGQFVVILQWARIVTESQSSTATGENPASSADIPKI
jgi:hypothetical protein